MILDKIGIVFYALRILLLFILKECRSKDIAVGTPDIAPIIFPSLYGVGRKIQIVLCTGINKAGYVDLVIIAAAVLNITGIRPVTAVAWLVRLI